MSCSDEDCAKREYFNSNLCLIIQYVSIKGFAVFLFLLDIQLQGLSNLKIKILQVRHWFKVTRYDESYTSFFVRSKQIYGLVAKASSSESGQMCLISAGC